MNIKDAIKEKLSSKIISWEEKSSRRIYFSIDKNDIRETGELLFKELGLRFSTASGCDTPEGLEMLYHFSLDKTGEFFSVRALIIDKQHPEIDSLANLFNGAEWIEREIWEMLGIKFKGHPNLKRLLLAGDWPEGKYPLRRENVT